MTIDDAFAPCGVPVRALGFLIGADVLLDSRSPCGPARRVK
ncbi:MAG: hypothetical protein ACRDD1_09690 [Planctomycetia bacterium]